MPYTTASRCVSHTPLLGGFPSLIARQPRGCQYRTIRLRKALGDMFPTLLSGPFSDPTIYFNLLWRHRACGKSAHGGVIVWYTPSCTGTGWFKMNPQNYESRKFTPFMGDRYIPKFCTHTFSSSLWRAPVNSLPNERWLLLFFSARYLVVLVVLVFRPQGIPNSRRVKQNSTLVYKKVRK